MGKSRRNRVVSVLGAGGVLATVLTGAGTMALAQPASARTLTLPKACVAIEALVGDGVSGPGLGGEVLRVTPGGQSTLTTNSSPPGSPPLDAPSDMAFLANGDIFPVSTAIDSPNSVVVLDMEQRPSGPGFGLGALIRVDLATGDRTVLSIDGTPKGSPVFDTPIDVRYDACEKAFYVLQTGFTPSTPPGKVIKVDAATGTRSLFAEYRGAENYALLLRPIPVGSPAPGGGGGGGTTDQPPNHG